MNASPAMFTMFILSTYIFSTTPPRPRVDFILKPVSVPLKRQLYTYILRAPLDISEPMTKPPWPWSTVQPSMITFWQGIFQARPSLSFPLFMQMASSPTSKVEFLMMQRLHDSRSRPSPFCAYQGLRIVTWSMVTSSHFNGWVFHAGELLSVTSCNNTRWHSVNSSSTGRCNTLRKSGLPSLPASSSCLASGYHTPL